MVCGKDEEPSFSAQLYVLGSQEVRLSDHVPALREDGFLHVLYSALEEISPRTHSPSPDAQPGPEGTTEA